jgi:hypothetical protein
MMGYTYRRHDGAPRMRLPFSIVITIGLALSGSPSHAEPGLDNCADQFPGGTVDHAPLRVEVAPDDAPPPIHICKRSGATSFFALEYDPGRLAPVWVAYRLSDTFGPDRCGSVPRDHMRCHFGRDDVQGCISATSRPGDPFHVEAVLVELDLPHLRTDAFARTQHDRGHMAPNNAFSWHLCGAYKTFTMANMAAQRDHLNRVTWERLEAQVLHWGVELGPIYEVMGPIWTRFPEEEFEIFKLGLVDRELMAQPDEPLRPDAGNGPGIVRPTGFFKVLYRPASEHEDEQAVAFLVPHTHQRGLSFWSFISTVVVVEQASGLEFGFDDRLKRGGRQRFWLDRRLPSGWSVRAPEAECADGYRAEGWFPELTRQERLTLCQGTP